MELMEHQLEAIEKLDSGKILYGGTGAGKTATVLGYYVAKESKQDIIVITTARKRDSLDWIREAAKFAIGEDRDSTFYGTIKVDSWNNIMDYVGITDAFFVFDEQRLVGTGAWVKSFMKIAKDNRWVMLSATPGDTWLDYAPVFIANGFYRNITDFKIKHILYEPYVRFPKIRGFLNVTKLEMLRNDVLVEMPYLKHTKRILNYLEVGYDQELFDVAYKNRWHVYEDRPIKDVAELFRVLRRIVNSDPSRLALVRQFMDIHPRLIVFYNFNYELDILRGLGSEAPVYEYNGHRHDDLPDGNEWVYLCQYVAGAEAWNCTTTDAMILYSLTYSFKNFEQVQGRIDRLDTSYVSLYYYILVSNSITDRAIRKSLGEKKNFNERKFAAELAVDVPPIDEHVEFCQI
jgi:hypothetical protein